MSDAKKITVDIPADLLSEAQAQTGKGITETVRQGLQLLAASRAYKLLLGLEGNAKLSKTWKQLKEDRE
jgi:hypothetical protein